jgi:meiotic recombination protein SPO11
VAVRTADEPQAKGYPDLSTRALLRRLSISRKPYNSHTPVFALVDFDPDGIAIMSTFKHGSIALDHENEALNVRSVHWLGLKSSDLDNQRETDDDCGLLRLTGRDRRMATKMLQRAIFAADLEVEWRRELQVMLMLNIKAEIQLQSGRPGGLEGWLENKISIGVNEMKQSSSEITS